jgi:predicted nucleic acid-binding protein
MRPIRSKVFLDTKVLIAYLRGDRNLFGLFAPAVMQEIRYVISPIVLQELFLAADAALYGEDLDRLASRLEVIPVEVVKSKELLTRPRSLRNQVAHANDFLILGSAQNCDYLLTYDLDLRRLGKHAFVHVLPPEDFLQELEEQP